MFSRSGKSNWVRMSTRMPLDSVEEKRGSRPVRRIVARRKAS